MLDRIAGGHHKEQYDSIVYQARGYDREGNIISFLRCYYKRCLLPSWALRVPIGKGWNRGLAFGARQILLQETAIEIPRIIYRRSH